MIIGTASTQSPAVEWNRTYGGSSSESFSSVFQTSDGYYIVAGTIQSAGAGGRDGWLLKLNSTGDEVWNRTYGGSGYDYFYSVAQASDGHYIVAGRFSSLAGSTLPDGWIVKIDNSTGNEIWNRTYGGSDYDWLYSVAQASDGNYLAAGQIRSDGAGGSDG